MEGTQKLEGRSLMKVCTAYCYLLLGCNSMVSFMLKYCLWVQMDKISVLADTIAYLKHLKKQVESLQDEVMKDDKAISFLGVQKRSLSTVNSGQSEDEEVNGSVIREF